MQSNAQLAEEGAFLVGALELWDTVVPIDEAVSAVEAHFVADPALPGVIIMSGSRLIGLLSRHRLLTALSQPFGREVFVKRPVNDMVKSTDTSPLMFSAETPIAVAAKSAMARSSDSRFEPLLVRCQDVLRLLDVPALLTAQTALLEAALGAKESLIVEIRRTAEELSAAREVAQHDSTHDMLTGLPNRKLFLEMLETAMAARLAVTSPICGVMFVDLDRFKLVNDSLGHAAGDRLLKDVADRLCLILRRPAADVASGSSSPRTVVARLSGDEFAVLLIDLERPAAADEIAQHVLADLARPFTVSGVTVQISASIGILPSIDQYKETGSILRDADIAMYQAKRQGKARAVVFEPMMRERARHRMQVENDLRDALLEKAFILHYQPIIDLRTHAVHGCEALVRYERAGKLVHPGDFIEVAEETGLILPLGDWVFREASRARCQLAASTPQLGHLMMGINLSPLQFGQPELCDTLVEMTSRAGIDPGMLTLEITERSAMANPDQALATLNRLKSVGFRLALDDFGTGYSSLNYLHRFPIDILKIDRSFIAELGTSASVTKIVTGILALAKSMNIEVTAEGIETAGQRDWLRQAGCQFGQGYYFGRPIPQAKIRESWLPADLYRSTDFMAACG